MKFEIKDKEIRPLPLVKNVEVGQEVFKLYNALYMPISIGAESYDEDLVVDHEIDIQTPVHASWYDFVPCIHIQSGALCCIYGNKQVEALYSPSLTLAPLD